MELYEIEQKSLAIKKEFAKRISDETHSNFMLTAVINCLADTGSFEETCRIFTRAEPNGLRRYAAILNILVWMEDNPLATDKFIWEVKQ